MTIEEFFSQYNKVALAFSGGVDSAYLLYAAKKYSKNVKAYYVKSNFQPEFELDDAKRLAEELKVNMEIIPLDVLCDEEITKNPENRCYFCKKRIFSSILQKAEKDGYKILIDGTNASDDYDDRPGMKVLTELSVLSPLRICGITKDKVRELSKEAGLFTWNKPAYACLATRIPTGEKITKEKLKLTEKSEEELSKMGFSDFRVRLIGQTAKIQVTEKQLNMVLEKRDEILQKLKPYYDSIILDLETR